MISPWLSAGAMWVTFATAAITALWNSCCRSTLSLIARSRCGSETRLAYAVVGKTNRHRYFGYDRPLDDGGHALSTDTRWRQALTGGSACVCYFPDVTRGGLWIGLRE